MGHRGSRLSPEFSLRCVANCSADVGADYGDDRPLDEALMHNLPINGVQLLNLIATDDAFVTELATVGCITWPQREHLMNIVQPRDRNDKLLEFLTRRSVAHFQKFVSVLAKEQPDLADLLSVDGGETCFVSLYKHKCIFCLYKWLYSLF